MATRGESLSPVQRSIDHIDDLLAQYSGTAATGQAGQTSSRGQTARGSQMSPQRDHHSSTPYNRQLLPPHVSGANAHPSHPQQQHWMSATGSVLASSWAAIPTSINGGSPDPVNGMLCCHLIDWPSLHSYHGLNWSTRSPIGYEDQLQLDKDYPYLSL